MLGQAKASELWVRRYTEERATLVSKYRNLLRSRAWTTDSFHDSRRGRALNALLANPSRIFGTNLPRSRREAEALLARGIALLNFAQNPRRDPCHPWIYCISEYGAGEGPACEAAIVGADTESPEWEMYVSRCGNRYAMTRLPESGLAALGQAETIPVSQDDQAEARRRLDAASWVGAAAMFGIGLLAIYLLTDPGKPFA
jgi:hypothetical protein